MIIKNATLSVATLSTTALFPCCLGIACPPSTVKVGNNTLRIDLHSPIPDGAVTDFGEPLQARGSLQREAQALIELAPSNLHQNPRDYSAAYHICLEPVADSVAGSEQVGSAVILYSISSKTTYRICWYVQL